MSGVIGMILIFSAIIIGCTFLVCLDMTFIEKLKTIAELELLICLVIFGGYLVAK